MSLNKRKDSTLKYVRFLQVNFKQNPNAGLLKILQNNSDFYLEE